jgi:hypothetical protein
MKKICKTQQQQKEAKIDEDQYLKEQFFVVSCLAATSFTERWLIDSGCINHMTNDRKLFRELDKIVIFKVRIENGAHLKLEGK